MLQGLLRCANRLLDEIRSYPVAPASRRRVPRGGDHAPEGPLERVVLTDEVGRTLFEEYARHRSSKRGNEETGWLLLGLRQARQAIALATLPAGTLCDAGVTHVRFNSDAQAVGSRIVRQGDRRLTILGLVHTHPGSLRHPSEGDLAGDRHWVRHLRGQEGIFAIGTADAPPPPEGGVAPYGYQPLANAQCLGPLRFSWYALSHGEARYRPLTVELTLGPDLARCLHPVWPLLELHAARLDRLFQQQAGMRVEVLPGPGLLLTIPLAAGTGCLRVVVGDQVRYYVQRGEELLEFEQAEAFLDRGVYLLLAHLASRG